MATVSAVIITKNEERNIEACLRSLNWVDEIIVVDAESHDRTVEIASTFTNKVFVKPWAGFGPQKNFAIEQAESDWILVVDADERVDQQLRTEIQQILSSEASSCFVGYRIPRKNFFYHRWIRSGGMYPDLQLRFFQQACGRYDNTLIHENLHLEGESGLLTGHLEHFTIPTIGDHVKKMMVYTSLAARQKLKHSAHVSMLNLAGNHLVTFVKTYVTRGGWRDGVPGLIAAGFAGLHTYVKYVKAFELQQKKPSESKGPGNEDWN